ncbi:hypothetical protein GCM10022384_63900 [Streptomyces marokkonensis]|uniref:Carrier domain-containing protein n=1 Tax=Streptomyces marokkonensis TaxID=324855 RepID=A0ABP7SCD6_9ACTN
MMAEQPWPQSFEQILRAHLTFLPADEPVVPELPLVDRGLDSLATVSLLLDLEEAFALTIPDELLTAKTFATPADLWSVIDSLVAAKPSSSQPIDGDAHLYDRHGHGGIE